MIERALINLTVDYHCITGEYIYIYIPWTPSTVKQQAVGRRNVDRNEQKLTGHQTRILLAWRMLHKMVKVAFPEPAIQKEVKDKIKIYNLLD